MASVAAPRRRHRAAPRNWWKCSELNPGLEQAGRPQLCARPAGSGGWAYALALGLEAAAGEVDPGARREAGRSGRVLRNRPSTWSPSARSGRPCVVRPVTTSSRAGERLSSLEVRGEQHALERHAAAECEPPSRWDDRRRNVGGRLARGVRRAGAGGRPARQPSTVRSSASCAPRNWRCLRGASACALERHEIPEACRRRRRAAAPSPRAASGSAESSPASSSCSSRRDGVRLGQGELEGVVGAAVDAASAPAAAARGRRLALLAADERLDRRCCSPAERWRRSSTSTSSVACGGRAAAARCSW